MKKNTVKKRKITTKQIIASAICILLAISMILPMFFGY